MSDCNCQAIKEEVKGLLRFDDAAGKEQTIRHITDLLTAPEGAVRMHGYKLFKEAANEALFRSCLDYGSLAGGFSDPLVEIVARAIEFWVEREDAPHA